MLGILSDRYSTVGRPMFLYIDAHSTVRSITPGIVAALFFRCMIALFNPTNRARGGIGWGLVAHTVALFANATVSIAIGYYILSESYINDREFPGGDGLPPGPTGYWWIPKFVPLVTVASSVIQLNQWLVDGLLVSSTPNSAAQVFNLSHFPSYTVVTSFTI